MNHIAKINISRVMTLSGFPIWLSQEALCVDRRDASRRVSLLRSLITEFMTKFEPQWLCIIMHKVSTILYLFTVHFLEDL